MADYIPSASEFAEDIKDIFESLDGDVPSQGQVSYILTDENAKTYKKYAFINENWKFIGIVSQDQVDQDDGTPYVESDVDDKPKPKTKSKKPRNTVAVADTDANPPKKSKKSKKPKLDSVGSGSGNVISQLQDIVDNFQSFQLDDIKAKLMSIISSSSSSTESKPDVPKPKRAPSEYQLFLSKTLPTLAHIPHKERMTHASLLWKEKKAAGDAKA